MKREALNLGVDDAGRGPVIGPMILAGCILDSESEKELKRLGVKDSKQLTPLRREFLVKEIKKHAKAYHVEVVKPEDIDKSADDGIKLNEVEALRVAKIVNKLNKDMGKLNVYVDCPSVSLVKWGDFLKTKIKDLSNLNVKVDHKAENKYVSVAAASILAKSRREEEMDKLKEIYGKEIGSGYPSDPDTIKFLEENVEKYSDEGIFRKIWKTYQNALAKKSQQKLKI